MGCESKDKEIVGPFIIWQNYGYEGWKPHSFNSIEEALKSELYNEWIITKRIDFKAVEHIVS